MKKLLLSSAALALIAGAAAAAHLPSIKSAPSAAPAPMWAGFHVGLNAGGTFGNNSSPNTTTWNLYQPAANADYVKAALFSGSGYNIGSIDFIGGGQIGYDWQFAYNGMGLIAGIEADIQGLAGNSVNGSHWTAANSDYFGRSVSLMSNRQGESNLQYFGTVRGRIGYLVNPTLLLYGTGGLSYGGVSSKISNYMTWNDTANSKSYLIEGNGSNSNTQVGWTAGGGLECMFLSNWSVKAEYLYYDLGRASGSFVNNDWPTSAASAGEYSVDSVTNYSRSISGNIIRAGLNYHFNFANTLPVVAKY